jgi:hypothetical protein
MTKRVKREASDMSFSLSRWFRKISESKPSAVTFIIILVGFTTFLMGGGMYQLITQTPIAFYANNKFYFLYTPELDASGSGLNGQLGMDVVISFMLYTFGLIGLLIMYRSTKNAYNPRLAYMTMMLGVTLIVFAYLFLETVIRIKGG